MIHFNPEFLYNLYRKLILSSFTQKWAIPAEYKIPEIMNIISINIIHLRYFILKRAIFYSFFITENYYISKEY